MSQNKQFYYNSLNDLYRYVRQYEIPLEEETVLSKLGSIIRSYLYKTVESFKINCKIGMEDRLISCCASLLPLTTSSSSSRNKKQKSDHSATDIYCAFNIRRAKSWKEPNAVLFTYPKYLNPKHTDNEKGIRLNFFAQKQLKYMVMATYIKPKHKKKRRGSTPSIKSNKCLPSTKLITSKSKPCCANRSRNNKYNSINSGIPSRIACNVAIIYAQDNLLWTLFKNKAKIIDHNAWLPILSLWKQKEANIVYMLRGINTKKKKKKKGSGRKRYKQKKNIQNQVKNPCKFYKITIGEKQVVCKNIFDFPYVNNIKHEFTWFDIGTQSLLLIINKNSKKYIELQIIKHHKSSVDKVYIAQSMTKSVPQQTKLNSSQLFHMKLEKESLRICVLPPPGYLYLFHNCRCLKFVHEKQSNSFLLLLEKYDENKSKILLKLNINFIKKKIECISFGIVNENKFCNNRFNIIGYDYHRSLLIIDTYYETLCPLSSNRCPFGKNKKILSKNKINNIYHQYNKWFTFASSNLFVKKKYQIITKQFIALSLNDFVDGWKNIYPPKLK